MGTPRDIGAPGIRWDAPTGSWRVFAEVGTGSRAHRATRSKRFADGTPLREMKAWQDGARVSLRAELAEAATPTATPPVSARPAEAETLAAAGMT